MASEPMWATVWGRHGGYCLFFCGHSLMKQGVRFPNGSKSKFEAIFELAILRKSVVKVWVTPPPLVGYVQS